jgi:hypothetical protein
MESTVRYVVEYCLFEAGVWMLRYRVHAQPQKPRKTWSTQNTKLTRGKTTPARSKYARPFLPKSAKMTFGARLFEV